MYKRITLDLKREFERHYTQRDDHFNRLITERMSDLKQTVVLLNQERIESKIKMEIFENKVFICDIMHLENLKVTNTFYILKLV